MPRTRKPSYRPTLEAAEPRRLTTGGIAGAIAAHPGAHAGSGGTVSAEAHHPRPHHHPAVAVIHHPATAPAGGSSHPGPIHIPGSASNPVVAGAWIELENTTGSAVSYSISLAPYDNGRYLNFTIPAGYPYPVQFQYAGLTATGPGSVANFQIQFSGGEPTPLATGPSQASAKEYGIFVNSAGIDYVVPLVT